VRPWLVAVLGLSSATAAADPTIETKSLNAVDLPRGVSARGDTFISAVSFVDKNGTNYVVLSSHASQKSVRDVGPSYSNYLYVDPWVVPARGKPRNLLAVRDMVVDCVMGDASARFHDDAFTVTDLNGNGIAEITFGYELANCRSDVRPATYKLLLLENGTKYILRGETRTPGPDGKIGGVFTPDPVAAKWPRVFLAHVEELWNRTADDLALPPRN
jgi:hypothetical protein